MKAIVSVLLLFISYNAIAQTTIRSQGNNVGNGRAYVAPITTKTYTTPSTPTKTYTAPAKTYNYNSKTSPYSDPSNSSVPSRSNSGAGTGITVDPNAPVLDYSIKFKKPTDEAIQIAIKMHDWSKAFELYEEPSYNFEERTQGGGKRHAANMMVQELAQESQHNMSLLPLLYKAVYLKKMAYTYPALNQLGPKYVYNDLKDEKFCYIRSCIYLGNFKQAIVNFRPSSLYGLKKPFLAKKKESYVGEFERYESARNYINYMSGRCFEAMGQADSAKKYLSIVVDSGLGLEAEWTRLNTESKDVRASKVFYDPDLSE